MAGKLYERQGRSFSLQPVNAEIKKPTLQPLTDVVVKNAAQIAADNYAMGNAIALHDSLKYAYEQAPASPQQFDELANKTIQSFMDANKVPSNARNALMAKFLPAKQRYATQVQANWEKKQDETLINNSNGLLDRTKQDYNESLYLQYAGSLNGDKDVESNGVYGKQSALNNLNVIAETKDRHGNYLYSDKQRQNIVNSQTGHLEAAKRAIYESDLETLEKWDKEVFQNRDKFMSDMGIDAENYEKLNDFIRQHEKQLKADKESGRFNENVRKATELQLIDSPAQIKELKDEGLLNSALIDSIEKTNAKFSKLNPSKTASPVAMIDLLDIVNSWDRLPEITTDDEKMLTLAQGTAALDAIANYAETHGLTPEQVNSARQMVVMKEQDRMYSDMLDNFGKITQSFGSEIPNMKQKLDIVRGVKTNVANSEFPNRKEWKKLVALNNTLAIAEDASRKALSQGDIETYNKIQQELPQAVAQIKYQGIIEPVDWMVFEKNKDHVFSTKDGQTFQIAGFTPDGDVIIK